MIRGFNQNLVITELPCTVSYYGRIYVAKDAGRSATLVQSYQCIWFVCTLFVHTRGIWKVLSMVFYLSNRFTNLIMFGIILKSYLSSILWHKFHEDIIMQTRKLLLRIHVLIVYWKTQNFSGKYNILPLKSVHNIYNSS